MINQNNFGKIVVLTINRPQQHNAFDHNLINELTDKLKKIKHNQQIHVVILTAQGQHFSAGADLAWMQKIATLSQAENEHDALQLAKLFEQLNSLPQATIALAHGKTFGGGMGLLACCDIVIASSNASFCFSEAQLGLIPATIAPYIVRKIGYSATRYYFTTALSFNSDKALNLGLVHQLCETDALYATGMQMAQTLLNNGPKAISAIKQQLDELLPMSDQLKKQTAKLLATIRSSDEAQARIQAFLHHRR